MAEKEPSRRFITMKMRGVVLLFAVALLTTVSVLAENVAGTWKGSYPGRDGQTRESTIVLKVEGEKLTGTVSGQRGESEIKDGTIKGDDISFSVVRNFGGNEVTVKYKGKVVGDAIQFKVEAGERSYEMTAKRVSP